MLCMPLYKPLNDTFSGEIALPQCQWHHLCLWQGIIRYTCNDHDIRTRIYRYAHACGP